VDGHFRGHDGRLGSHAGTAGSVRRAYSSSAKRSVIPAT
jgi:hypothetical protein